MKKSQLEILKEENERLKKDLEIAKLEEENRELREEIERRRFWKYKRGTTTISYGEPMELVGGNVVLC